MAVSTLAPISPRAVAQTAAVTYAEALQRAQAQSPARKRAVLAGEQAAAARALVDYEDDPRLSAQASIAQRYRDAEPVRGVKPESITREQTYGLTLSAPLYDFGRIAAKQRQADATTRARTMALAEVDETLRFAVARAYLGVIGAERLARIAREQRDVAAAKAAEQTRNYRQGLRPESDVVTAELDRARAETALARATDDTRAARMRLAQLMGDDAGAQALALPEASLALPPPAEWSARAAAWQDAGAALPGDARRTAEREGLAAADDGIAAGRRPQLAASLGAQEVGTLAPLRPAASGQLSLSWDVPWNGQARAARDELALRRRSVDLEEETERRERQQTAALAAASLEQERGLWAMLERQLELAQKQQRLIKARYEAGKASAIDLSNSEGAVLAAKLELAKAAQAAAAAALGLAEAKGVRALGAPF